MTTQITSINELTKDFLLTYIADLPREERNKLTQYVTKNTERTTTPNGYFSMVRSYIWNTYFTKKNTAKGTLTFKEQLEQLLKF